MSSKNVIKVINDKFGDDVANLSLAKEFYDDILKQKVEIESSLNFASSNVPGKLEIAVKGADECENQIKAFFTEHEELNGDISNYSADVSELHKKLEVLSSRVETIESFSSYLKCVQRIETLSSSIEAAIEVGTLDKAAQQFSFLSALVEKLRTSDCKHLVKYAIDVLMYWHRFLKEKITSDFELVLNAWKWPFVVTNAKRVKPLANAEECKNKLPNVFSSLLALKLPSNIEYKQCSKKTTGNIIQWKPILLPIQVMLKPLKVRFKFHFYGNKQTNNLDKPEWYMTQIFTWIRDHRDFLTKKIQPLLENENTTDALNEFIRGLVQLVIEKMAFDLPELLYDDQIFCHFIDESLAFYKELCSHINQVSVLNMCLCVLTQSDCFNKWLKIEKKFATEKIDMMMSSVTAWEAPYKDLCDVDEHSLPECTEAFITLMLSITDRYKTLPSIHHKMKFVELQLELLEDYRLRLVQVKNTSTETPLSEQYIAILNSVSYIEEVLRQWTELPFFVELHLYKIKYEEEQRKELLKTEEQHVSLLNAEEKQSSMDHSEDKVSVNIKKEDIVVEAVSLEENDVDILDGTLFDNLIELYAHLKSEMLNNILRYIIDDVKARSRPYRKDKWLLLPSQKDMSSLALSTSACEMLMVLKDLLQLASTLLSKNLFTTCWQKVAEELDAFIYKEVILGNHFNDGGAAQLQFDMTRNLFPLFGQYTQKPENYFKDVKEACILLTVKMGTAMLLKEVLYQALHDPHVDKNLKLTDPVAALHDHGVFKLTPDDAELVLSLRASLD